MLIQPNVGPTHITYSCRLLASTVETDLADTQRAVAALPGRKKRDLHHETSMGILTAWRRPHQRGPREGATTAGEGGLLPYPYGVPKFDLDLE